MTDAASDNEATASPIELYRKRDYTGAVNLLKDQAAYPSDRDKALLAECLFMLNDYQASLNAIGTVSSPTSYDLELGGLCCLRIENYESAEMFFNGAIEQEGHSNTYYLLAVACQRDLPDFRLDAPTKEKILAFLDKAVALPDCPLAAYLWLESLHKYEDIDIESRIRILEEAVSRYPSAEEPRIRLANWYTNRLREPDRALAVLESLMKANTSNPHVWMKAYSAARENKNLSLALSFLERVTTTDEASRFHIELFKADLHLELHNFDGALNCYSEVGKSNAADLMIVSMFGRTRSHLGLGNLREAVDEARNATQLFLNSDIYLSSYDPVFIENDSYGYEFLRHIETVSNHYLQSEVDELDPEMVGGLCYVLYEVGFENGTDSEPDSALLVKAHKLNSHPRISKGLATYCAQQKQWASAVTHHLTYCLWAHENNFRVLSDTEFLDEAEEYVPTIRKADRTKIAKVASKQLNEYIKDDEVLRNIFEPFYRRFWRQLLLKDDASTTVVAIAAALIHTENADNDILWDYAYHLAKLGKTDQAVAVYEDLLEKQPKNAAALHNLSILKEEKGFFAEALELSSRAVSFAPADNLILRRYEQLKDKSRKIQIQKGASTRSKSQKPPAQDTGNNTGVRKGVTKKVRFEVFKRDSFTCQYCGKKAPDVVLEADHIEPASKGGSGDILNLITSCHACNSGKSDRRLADNTVVEKQRKQLAEMQERREQIEMMLQWQRDLTDLNTQTVDQVAEMWADLVNPFSLTSNGKVTLAKLLKQFPLDEVVEAIRIAVRQYIEYDGDSPTKESVEKSWSKIGGICRIARVERDKPYMRDLYYIRGILRNRLSYTRDWQIMKMLEEIVLLGGNIEELKNIALEARSWTNWTELMADLLQQIESNPASSTPPQL